jgi:hypothetical protein
VKTTETGAIEVQPPCAEYEQACLDAVREILLESTTLRRDGTVIKSVELVRSRDCTCIVVFLVRSGIDTRTVWRLYEDVFHGTLPPGQAENPEGVATGVWISVMGG